MLQYIEESVIFKLFYSACMFRGELLEKLNNFVHLNLCIALASGLLIFLVGIEGAKRVDVSPGCLQSSQHNMFVHLARFHCPSHRLPAR